MRPYDQDPPSDESLELVTDGLGAVDRDYICESNSKDVRRELCQSGVMVSDLIETIAFLVDRIKALEAKFK